MYLEFMTREVWDTLILAVILIGGALAAVRIYRDFTRPLPGERSRSTTGDIDADTKPHLQAVQQDDTRNQQQE